MKAPLFLARSVVRDLKPYSSARSLGVQGEVFLDANESPWAPFPGGELSIGLNRYPEPQPERLRQALANLYGVESNQILIGRGSDEAIDTLVRAFCEPNRDQVLVCPPTYGVYECAAHLQGAEVVRVPTTSASGFAPDAVAILHACRPETKLVFLCSPNNPTGNLIAPATLEQILLGLENKAIVVLDEAYIEFAGVANASFTSRLHEFSNLVILRTLSKAWALAGARCGVALGHADIINLLQKVRAPYPLSTPTVRTALSALSAEGEADCRKRVQRLRAGRSWLEKQLSLSPLVETIFASEANFVLVKTFDAPIFLERCLRRGIVVRDRSSDFDLKNCVRVSVGSETENERLIAALAEGGNV